MWYIGTYTVQRWLSAQDAKDATFKTFNARFSFEVKLKEKDKEKQQLLSEQDRLKQNVEDMRENYK